MEKGFKGKSQVGWTEAYSKGYDAIDWGKTSEKNKEETKMQVSHNQFYTDS